MINRSGNLLLHGTDGNVVRHKPFVYLQPNCDNGERQSIARRGVKRGRAIGVVFTVGQPNIAPTVSLTSPANGASFRAGGTVTVTATAADADGSIARVDFLANGSVFAAANAADSDGSVAKVEFLLNGIVVGTSTTAPYTFTASNVAAGNITATARATDNDGASTTSTGVTVAVAANQAPNVSITAPASGATFNSPVDITVTLSASDSDGSVAKVELFAGVTLLATLTTAPYTTVWRNPLPGSYVLTARATDDRGATRTSTAVPITIGGTAVSITAPADNASFAAPATFNLAVTAKTSSGTITKLDFYDGTNLLGTINIGVADASATFNLPGVAAGSHVYTVKATLSSGAIVTSAPVTVNVLSAAGLVLTTLSNYYLAPAAIDLYANVTPAANTTISKVEFFSNGANLIGTITTPPYNFRWSNVVAGSYVVTAKVTDSRGLVATSAALSLTVSDTVAIQMAAGLNGSTVNEDAIVVSGTVSAPPNSAVNVNGQLASVINGGQFFLNDLNLQPGANTVTATVTAPDGQTANQVISITRSAVATTFTVSVTPNGLAAPGSPFIADVTIENPGDTAFATVSVSCNDPGAGLDSATVGTFQCPYAEPGSYTVRVTVKNGLGGVIYSTTKRVTVKSAAEHVLSVKAVYSTVIDRLLAGDKDSALKLFFSQAQVKYAQIFADLGANLGTAAAQFGSVSLVSAGERTGEIVVVRNVAGEQRVFMVYLMLGEDGVWRIESM